MRAFSIRMIYMQGFLRYICVIGWATFQIHYERYNSWHLVIHQRPNKYFAQYQGQRSHAYKIKQDMKTLKASDPERYAEIEKFMQEREEVSQLKEDLQKREARLATERAVLETKSRDIANDLARELCKRNEEARLYTERREQLEAEYQERLAILEAESAMAKRRGTDLADAFQNTWTANIKNSSILAEFLNEDHSNSVLAGELPSADVSEGENPEAERGVERGSWRLGNPLEG